MLLSVRGRPHALPARFRFQCQSSRHHFSTRGTEVPEDLKDILRPRKSEGAGKTGCALHPRSRRRCCTRTGCPRAYRFSGEHPASPTQWLYGLYEIVLVTGFLATIADLKLSPLVNLTPAPGRRTQSISPYALPRSSFAASRPSLPAPRLRRRPTPLWWDRMAEVLLRIFRCCQQFIFDSRA